MIIFVDGIALEIVKGQSYCVCLDNFPDEEANRVGRALLFGDRIARRLAGK